AWIDWYIRAYPTSPWAEYYRYVLSNAYTTKRYADQQVIGREALMEARNISLRATTGDIVNESVINARGGTLSLNARRDVINRAQAERDRKADGSYTTKYHRAGLWGTSVSVYAGRNLSQSRAGISARHNYSVNAHNSLSVAGNTVLSGSLSFVSRGGSIYNARRIETQGSIYLSGRTAVDNRQALVAQGNVTLASSHGWVANRHHIDAKRDVVLKAGGNIENHGAVARGVMTVRAGGDVINRYRMYGYNRLDIEAGRHLINQGYATRHSYLYGGHGVKLFAGADIRNIGGSIWSYRDINLEAGRKIAGSVINKGIETRAKSGPVYSGTYKATEYWTTTDKGSYRASVIDARNSGNLRVAALRGNIDNTGSVLKAGGAVSLYAAGGINLSSEDFSDTKNVKKRVWRTWTKRKWFRKKRYWAYTDYVTDSVTARKVARSQISAGTDLSINVGHSITLQGGLSAKRNVSVTSRGGDIVNNLAWKMPGSINMWARNNLTNKAAIEAAYDVNLTARYGTLRNDSTLVAKRDMRLNAGRDVNTHYAVASRNLAVSAGHSVTNRYKLYGYNTLTASAGLDIVNLGTASRHSYLYGAHGVTLLAGRNVINHGARIWSYRDINIEAGRRVAGSLINRGIESRSKSTAYSGTYRKTEYWTTTDRGSFRDAIIDARGQGNLRLVAHRGNIENVGSLLKSNNAIAMYASGNFRTFNNDYSDLVSKKTRKWRSWTTGALWWKKRKYAYTDSVTNKVTTRKVATGRVYAAKTLSIHARETASFAGDVRAAALNMVSTPNISLGGAITINNSRNLTLATGGNISIGADLQGSYGSDGVLRRYNVIDLYSNGRITASRFMRANGRITLNAGSSLVTKGLLAHNVELTSRRSSVRVIGAMIAGDRASITARGVIEARGIVGDAVSLASSTGDIAVKGFSASDGADSITGKTLFANHIARNSDGFLASADIANRSQGMLHAYESLNVSTPGTFRVTNGMTVSSENDLAITAGSVEVISNWTGSRLLRSAILSGGDLSLNTTGRVLNQAGTISSKGNLYITAGGSIENRAVQTSFKMTSAHGCEGKACGRNGVSFAAAEILSGEGMILTSNNSIINEASQIAAAGSVVLHARNSIQNKTRSGKYRIVDVYKKKCFIICYSKTVKQQDRAVIESGVIQTEFGDITLRTDRGSIINIGSFLSSGGDLTVQAAGDVVLNATSFEVHNLYKKRGFSGFLTYSSNKTYWNNFATALSQLEGMNVTVAAGNDIKGIGATIMALDDLTMSAGRDMSFDAKQNKKYLTEKGWSFGLTSSKFKVSQGLIQSGDALQAYLNDNPALAAVHELATAEDGWGTLNGTMALIWHGSATLANANSLFKKLGSVTTNGNQMSMSNALAQQFIPSDFNDFRDLRQCRDLQSCAAAAGIGFRFEMWESRREWTESHVSRLGAGGDLVLSSGRDIALVGGTIASAADDVTIVAGRDFLMSAVADNTRTTSSGWGLNISFSGDGVTVGGHANGAKSAQTIYTNATLTAGDTLSLVTGRDARLLGAVVKGRDVYFDIARDLVIASRQNTSSNSSWGFNASITFNGATVTGFSLGGNYGKGNRKYTDTPTWIEANRTLDVYVGRTTYLMGAVMNSKNGDVTLDTGAFIFDDFRNVDKQVNVGGSISFGRGDSGWGAPSGSFNAMYRNVQGVTYATVAGENVEIRVRSNPDIDLRSLNTDAGNVHKTTKNVYINIKIPGINLQTLRNNLAEAGDFIRAATAGVPDAVRLQGAVAMNEYRRLISNGAIVADAARVAQTPEFRELVKRSAELSKAVAQYGSIAQVPEGIRTALLEGAVILYAGVDGVDVDSVVMNCDLMGTNCRVALDEYLEALRNAPDRVHQANAAALRTFNELYPRGASIRREGGAIDARLMRDLSRAFVDLINCVPTADFSRAEAMAQAHAADPLLFASLMGDHSDTFDLTIMADALDTYASNGDASQFEQMFQVAAAAAQAQSQEEFRQKLQAIGGFVWDVSPAGDIEAIITSASSGDALGVFVAAVGFIPIAKVAKAAGRTGS
ncbi:MAG: hemagglutinin repeat-containing protein, partial [Pseudomonadota bacterium]